MDTVLSTALHNRYHTFTKMSTRCCDFRTRAGNGIWQHLWGEGAKESAAHRCRSWSTWEKEDGRSGRAPPLQAARVAGPGRAYNACHLRAWAPAFIARCWTPGWNPGPARKGPRRKVQEARCQFLGPVTHQPLLPMGSGDPPNTVHHQGLGDRLGPSEGHAKQTWGDRSPHLA